ncbi:MAG: hypothetical protein WBN42_01810 [Ignavibacteriaceae bacterium]
MVPENSIYYLEIVTPDVESMCNLYTSSFGWEFQPEKPTIRMYLRVLDLAASVEQVAQKGAKILLDCMEIPGHGIIAIYEIGGIECGIWKI